MAQKADEAFEELAQVIKQVIDEALDRENKENNLSDKSFKNRCAFCGVPRFDVVIPRGHKSLKVCVECYQGALAIRDSERRDRGGETKPI